MRTLAEWSVATRDKLAMLCNQHPLECSARAETNEHAHEGRSEATRGELGIPCPQIPLASSARA